MNIARTDAIFNNLCSFLVNSMQYGLIVTDLHTRIIYVNKATELITGYRAEELLGKSPAIFNAEEQAEKIQAQIIEQLSKNKTWKGELRQKRKNNKTYWAELEVFPIQGEDGSIQAWASIQRDISQRKKMEQKLKESEAFNRLLVEHLQEALFVVTPDGRYLEVNQAACSLHGYSRGELLKMNLLDTILPVNRAQAGELLNILQKEKYLSKEMALTFRDGRKGIIEIRAQVMPDGNYLGIVRDISERKQLEKQLKESKDCYRKLVELSPDIIVVHRDNQVRYINQIGLQYLGLTDLKEIIGQDLLTYLHPDSHSEAKERMSKILEFEQKAPLKVYKFLKPDGSVLEGEISALPFVFEGQKSILSVIRDISERSYTQKKLKEQQQQLKQEEKEKELILSSISELVVFHDTNMKIKWANATAAQHVGIAAEDLVGRSCYEVWQGTSSPCPDCPIKDVLSTKVGTNKEMHTPDGHEWQIKAFPAFNEEGILIGVVEVAQDITEAKRVKKEMARLERLNLVGEMAAGFGHEIRNPMATVRGFLQILQGKPQCLEYNRYFELMIEEIDRANSIISEFLSLAKDKVINLQEYNLNSIIEGLYPLISADAIHNDQTIELELTAIPNVFLDKKETYQLILNLVRNGLEAMLAGGCLTIKTYLEEDEVILAVEDQGSGIAPEILSRLGNPFVTTKENGTGLGLAICYSIVERHNAKMEMASSSEGTAFYIKYKQIRSISR